MPQRIELLAARLSPDELHRRFWARIDRTTTPDSCWPWTAHVHAYGYGRLTVQYQSLLAHRVAWTLVHGPIPDGLWVLHRCDNPRCCNPDHLWLGTNRENTADRLAKGRSASGQRNGSYTQPNRRRTGDQHWSQTNPEKVPLGEGVHNARLTEKSVRSIRLRHSSGIATVTELSREYGVTKQAIYNVVTRRTWSHVE